MAAKIEPVDAATFTDCMEQLQEAYVYAVAATAGCSATKVAHDTFKKDFLIVRPARNGGEETSLYVQLKNTTTLRPDRTKPNFSYQFKKRGYMEDLVKPRKMIKAILVVMAAHPKQADWTLAGHDHLRVHHCCYWKWLEGETVPAGVKYPSNKVNTADIFDAAALTKIMDKLDRGEALH